MHFVELFYSIYYNLAMHFVELSRGATKQSTLDERGEFHENSIPILRVECSCIYNNL